MRLRWVVIGCEGVVVVSYDVQEIQFGEFMSLVINFNNC